MPLIIKTHAGPVSVDCDDNDAHALQVATCARQIVRRGDAEHKADAHSLLSQSRPRLSRLITAHLAQAAASEDWKHKDANMRLVMKAYRATR